MIRLLSPEEMTPTARRQLEALCEQAAADTCTACEPLTDGQRWQDHVCPSTCKHRCHFEATAGAPATVQDLPAEEYGDLFDYTEEAL